MTNKLHIASISTFILAAFLLLSVFAALPVGAAVTKPAEGCTLAKNIDAKTAAGVEVTIVAGSEITAGTGDIDTDGGPYRKWGLICLVNTVNVVTNWIFIALLIVAVAFIAIAGFMWMTAGGNPEQQKKAGTMILAAVIGIIIAILARVIPGIVTGILL